MENLKTNNSLKVAFGVVLALFLLTGIYTFSLYSESKSTEKQLVSEKQQVMNDLDKMVKQYDIAIAENKVKNQNLEDARGRIQRLIDSLETSKNTVNSLFRYKKRYLMLEEEMNVLLEENDRLKLEKELLAMSLDSTQVQLKEKNIFADSLVSQNTKLTTTVKMASALQTVGLKGLGVIERSSGKQIPTERARRSDKLKVCYTVTKNELAEAGDKVFYVQVIDPNSNVLGSNEQVEFGNKVLNYSLTSTFEYLNDHLDICEYITRPEKSKFAKGIYYINVFNGAELMSSSQFELK